MSEDRAKSGAPGPTGSPVKPEAGSRRASRTSDRGGEGSSPPTSVGLPKKGREPGSSPRTTGTRPPEPGGATRGPGAYDRPPAASYDARSPAAAYDARPFDTRSPPGTFDARSPPGAFEVRSPPGTFQAKSPPGTFEARSPPGTFEARSPPGTFEARSPPGTFEAARSPQATYDPARSPQATYDPARSPQATYDPARSPQATYEAARPAAAPGSFPAAEAEGPGGSPTQPEPGSRRSTPASVQPEPGSRRSTAASVQPSGARSVAEEGAVSPNDAYNAEFSYYCAVLRTYAPSLSREYDKATTRLWMRKLFGPEYHPTVLKPKRNKYLLYLSITIYNDEAYGIFKQEPPCGKLPEITDIPFDKDFPPAAWETEVQWTDTLSELPDELKMSECYLHDRDACPAPDEKLAGTLDAEFQFFLWLAKPYVTLLPDPEEKTTAACWIRLLCGVASQREDCVALKEIRNDYMQALLGYVHDLRVEGPFRLMPPAGPLPPLALLYEDCLEDEFADPAGNQAQEFLSIQRLPESGAFAYINVTGELFGNL